MTFTNELYEKGKAIWQAQVEHPFVQGIGYGNLDKEKFRFYMVQDYLYLIEYAKLFAIGALKSSDVDDMRHFTTLQDAILNYEMKLHIDYCKQFGITEQELKEAKPAETMLAYTHYMLHQSQNGGVAELLAALLPCVWGYHYIGVEISKIDGAKDHEFYGNWVKMYESEEFGNLSIWLRDKLNDTVAYKSEEEKKRLEEIFLTTSKYEFMFWEMAWNERLWPKAIEQL